MSGSGIIDSPAFGYLVAGVGDASSTFSGTIQNTAGLVKVGSGVLTFAGNANTSGYFTVSGGAIQMPGGLLAPAALDVGNDFAVTDTDVADLAVDAVGRVVYFAPRDPQH